jgi:hypothetical protein
VLSFPTPSLPCLSNKESTCWGRSPTVSVHKVPRSKWCNIVSSNLHWQRTVLIAWPPERLLITWILPPKGKWLQRLNLLPAVFRDAVTWSCRLPWLVFNMYNNARKWCWVPLRSPEHMDWAPSSWSFHTELHSWLYHPRCLEEEGCELHLLFYQLFLIYHFKSRILAS